MSWFYGLWSGLIQWLQMNSGIYRGDGGVSIFYMEEFWSVTGNVGILIKKVCQRTWISHEYLVY